MGLMPPKDALRIPTVAWPTIALLIGVYALFAGSTGLALTGHIPVWLAAALNTIAAFAAFTPMHDAAHRSVGRKRWLNEVIGRLAGLLLGAPFAAFRYVHLEHHKYTNEPGKDPDLYSGGGPRLLLPLRWMPQDLHYYVIWIRRWSERPWRDKRALLIDLAVVIAIIATLNATGHTSEWLVFWFLPSRIAISMLAWSFDYVPHRPHTVPSREDRLRATHAVRGPFSLPLTIPLLSQNYHIVHHLYPGVPFYGYPRVWWALKDELLAGGTKVVPIVGRVD